LVESLPWGDVDNAIRDVEEALTRALDATRDDFRRWEEEPEGDDPGDEFSLDTEEVASLSPERRLARGLGQAKVRSSERRACQGLTTLRRLAQPLSLAGAA